MRKMCKAALNNGIAFDGKKIKERTYDILKVACILFLAVRIQLHMNVLLKHRSLIYR